MQQPTQQNDIKALALRALERLERNRLCNSSATTQENECNKQGDLEAVFVACKTKTKPKLIVNNIDKDSSQSRLRKFAVVVDDRRITVLASPGESDARILKSITDRFGAERITSIAKIRRN